MKHPVYEIQKFNCGINRNDLYVNSFKKHLVDNSFIEKPHSHNFYLLVLFTKGLGVHKIDFNTYEIQAGSLFFLQPGQIHSWQLSQDIEGYIVFCNQDMYNFYFGNKKIEEYTFYNSSSSRPEIKLDEKDMEEFSKYFELMLLENDNKDFGNIDKVLNLLDIIHIEISRKYFHDNDHVAHSYNKKIDVFKQILKQYYLNEKAPSFYAEKLNISLKHLNRICKTILNSTVNEMITDRVLLEGKRMLVNSDKTISEIADYLGFENYSYFTRVFKKSTGFTPREFRKNNL